MRNGWHLIAPSNMRLQMRTSNRAHTSGTTARVRLLPLQQAVHLHRGPHNNARLAWPPMRVHAGSRLSLTGKQAPVPIAVNRTPYLGRAPP